LRAGKRLTRYFELIDSRDLVGTQLHFQGPLADMIIVDDFRSASQGSIDQKFVADFFVFFGRVFDGITHYKMIAEFRGNLGCSNLTIVSVKKAEADTI
jgi:hypothetical protein